MPNNELMRCDDCGGLVQGYGEWADAVAVCICKGARHPAQAKAKRDALPADLSHGGHLANPWAFSELAGRGAK